MKIINILFISSLLTIFACSEKEATEENGHDTHESDEHITLTETQLTNSKIRIGKLKKSVLDKQLTTFGELAVAPADKAELHLVHQAFIEGTKILPGEKVKKGQILATYSHPEILQLQGSYLATTTRLKQLEADYSRKKSLVEDQSISMSAFQEAESNYLEQKVNAQSMQSMLSKLGVNLTSLKKGNLQERLHLRAPFSGIITEVNISVGMLVQPSLSLFELINLDEIHLEFKVFPKDVEHLKEGQRVTFKLPEGKKSYDCTIHFINKKVIDHGVLVHADMPKAVDLPLGAQLEVNVHMTTDTMFLLSKKAVLREGDKNFAFIELSKGEYEKIEIVPIDENDDFVGIELNALDDTKNYVLEGAYYLNTASAGHDH